MIAVIKKALEHDVIIDIRKEPNTKGVRVTVTKHDGLIKYTHKKVFMLTGCSELIFESFIDYCITKVLTHVKNHFIA